MNGSMPPLLMGEKYTLKWSRAGRVRVFRGAVYIGRQVATDGALTVSGPAFSHPDGQLVVSTWLNVEIERERPATEIIQGT